MNELELLSKKIIENELYKEEFSNRVKEELNLIEKLDVADYFLKASKFIDYIKDNGHVIGTGFGSTNSSIINYILGITIVNPLDFDLIFERFINSEINKPIFLISVSSNEELSDSIFSTDDFIRIHEYPIIHKIDFEPKLLEKNFKNFIFEHSGTKEIYNNLEDKNLLFQEYWIVYLSQITNFNLHDSFVIFWKILKRELSKDDFLKIFPEENEKIKLLYDIVPFTIGKSNIVGKVLLELTTK